MRVWFQPPQPRARVDFYSINDTVRALFYLFSIGFILCSAELRANPDQLLLCGADRVWAFDPANRTTTWSWQAKDSPEIPVGFRAAFRSTDECKPVGEYVLVTSSSGGVALIIRENKRCAFYTYARNAHSACLLPGMRVAVAASTGGDALMVFDRRKSGDTVQPIFTLPLKGAHGVLWDAHTESCWALGTDVLLQLNRNLKETARYPLPTPGGHDLSFTNRRGQFFITSNTRVYLFDMATRQFTPHAKIGDLPKIKSVDQHIHTGQIVYQQAMPQNWWGHHIHFEAHRNAYEFSNQRLYKIRWDLPVKTPRATLAEQLQKDGAHVFFDEKSRIKEVVLNQHPHARDHVHRLAWMPYLTDLSLENTAINDQDLVYISNLKKLEWLNLWQTAISDDGLHQLAHLTKLQHLPVGGTSITDAGLVHLSNLTELRYLGLRRTAITDAGVANLQSFTQLEALNLGETKVTNACIPQLSTLRTLKKLWINDTAISTEGLRQLQEALPGCLIIR